jgi:citrate lyase subunit beta/citryl-CoA lyase
MRFRSLLFVPGSRPDRFAKATAAGADDVIIDLEDAVAPTEKAQAREAVRAWLSAGNSAMVRVNGADTPWFSEDLSLCALAGVTAVVLPKAERATDVLRLSGAGAKGVLPLVETAVGIDALDEIARAPNVLCLAFGSLDLQVDLGMRGASEDDLGYFRSRVVLASRLANLPPPIDGISPAIDDVETLRVDVARSRRMGFGGKLCIHPRQIAEVHVGFAPTAEEREWARKIVDAVKAAGGAVVNVDGKMVDKPVLLRAEAILRDVIAT